MERLFSHDLLQSLYIKASAVLHEGASPSLLQEPLEQLAAIGRFRDSEEGQRALQEARRLHESTEIDIDRATMVYHNDDHDDDGYWVMAWCFVPSFDTDHGEMEAGSDSLSICQ